MLLSPSLNAQTIKSDDSILAEYIKSCELTKLNFNSCQNKFDSINENRKQDSFWISTEGEVLKFVLYFSVGAITAKALHE